MSILYLYIPSISSHINNLEIFLNLRNTKLNIICISESTLSQKIPQATNIQLPGYNIEHTPTTSTAFRALIYISENLSCRSRKDLQIYSSKELESVFIELLILNKWSYMIGTVYKHPPMKHFKFNELMRNL